MSTWADYSMQLAIQARVASRQLAVVNGAMKTRWLNRMAEMLQLRQEALIAENAKDLGRATEFGLSDAAIDRLRLTPSRLNAMGVALREISLLPDPVGEVIEGSVRPNGLMVSRVRVPLGVVFFIFESRPNVTIDAAALCVKSGNAVILRGGKEALNSNLALHGVVVDALADVGLPQHSVQMVATPEREVVGELLKLGDKIDVTIPRGGKSLIERVTSEATMPVIKHFDGVCHIFVDHSADLRMALEVIRNSKCQRPGVCNAAESVLIHRGVASSFLPKLEEMLRNERVSVRGCQVTCEAIPWATRAVEEDYRTEYLDLVLSVRVVDSLDEAIAHIDSYGSHHTDSILTESVASADRFVAEVDSAAVMVNASTRFNDGGELGLGAEIGISTDKFHARGPCGLRELTSYKWICRGSGQIR